MLHLADGFKGERLLKLPISIREELKSNALSSNLYLTDIGFYPMAIHHYFQREHGASEYILIFCRQGKGWCEVGDKKYKLNPNDFIILPPNVKHSYGSNEFDPWTIYWVHFTGSQAESVVKEFLTPTTITPNYNVRISEVISTFEHLYDVLRQGYSRQNVQYAVSLLFHFLGAMMYMGRNTIGENDSEGGDNFEKIVSYMKDNIDQRLDINELAKYVGFPANTIAGEFKKRTGYSLLNYFNQLKIQEACLCLVNTDLSVAQVSMKVGIEDQFYFSRLFSSLMGVSPKNYRTNNR